MMNFEKMELSKQPEVSKLYKKDLSEYGQILTVETSPFVLSQDVILIGFEKRILLGHLKVSEHLDFEILAEFKQFTRCNVLTISPETSISILPNNVIFAAAGTDYKLRVFRSDLRGDNMCKTREPEEGVINGETSLSWPDANKSQELDEHSSYINDTKFDPENNYLVSVSDDNTAKLWETEDFKCVATLQLTSPGMSVCWHKEDNSKLLVAEKIGLIRFYNVETQCPILSLDCGKPLSSCHWAPSDSQLIASLQLGELLIWDLSKPCVPINSNLVFTEAGGHIKFSPLGELVAAVNGLDGTLKVVHVQNNQIKLSVPVTLPTNVSWHCRAPIICVGDYKNLTFWKVVSK